ncbi:hypothetical protein GCM10027430_29300 [Lysobacter tyrosinilyticus]
MSENDQPRESDLEHVASLSGDDVATIKEALMQHVGDSWLPALTVVTDAHQSLLPTFPSVPPTFFSWCLRKLVASGQIQADGPATRELAYQVRVAADPRHAA